MTCTYPDQPAERAAGICRQTRIGGGLPGTGGRIIADRTGRVLPGLEYRHTSTIGTR